MIFSHTPISVPLIANHYNELDSLYRKVWGEHVHHGWFFTGRETKEQATLNLSKEVARLSDIKPGDKVCDIGCGYGGTARFLAEQYCVDVLGLTISKAQYEVANSSPQGHVQIRNLDWLENDLPSAHFDHLISIESSEHMLDKQKFFAEAVRVLKPGGTFVICAWLTRENPGPHETQWLLEPICREGRLPSMGSESEYRKFFADNNFEVQSARDLSHAVKRTWTLSLRSLVKHLAINPKDVRLLFRRFNSNAEFLKTLFRIRAAYETGAMRYIIFKAVKLT